MEKMFIEGFLLQASLIFALGAQNLFVLESGLRKQHHFVVSLACFFCDFFLIMLGVIGAGTLFSRFPEVKIIVGVLGVIFLFQYGLGKLFPKQNDFSIGLLKKFSLKESVLGAMAFSLLNPHAYLDGIVLIGGYSSKYSLLSERLSLGLGASICSLAWFILLSTAATKLVPVFENPRRMRFVMSTAGALLIALSVKMSLNVYDWILLDERVQSIAFLGQH
jgi:L-lysine exporter family protein LysE/ArgO